MQRAIYPLCQRQGKGLLLAEGDPFHTFLRSFYLLSSFYLTTGNPSPLSWAKSFFFFIDTFQEPTSLQQKYTLLLLFKFLLLGHLLPPCPFLWLPGVGWTRVSRPALPVPSAFTAWAISSSSVCPTVFLGIPMGWWFQVDYQWIAFLHGVFNSVPPVASRDSFQTGYVTFRLTQLFKTWLSDGARHKCSRIPMSLSVPDQIWN